jgi:hypothetical protein
MGDFIFIFFWARDCMYLQGISFVLSVEQSTR